MATQLRNGKMQSHSLEKLYGPTEQAVRLRRLIFDQEVVEPIPYKEYDYSQVHGRCCENVIGYVPIPVGVVGPYIIDGVQVYVPMATTEGCLVASTSRGCKAINYDTGAVT